MIFRLSFASLALGTGNICGDNAQTVELTAKSVDTNHNKEASGLFLSKTYLYTFSDSPEDKPYIWAINKTDGSPVGTIKITNITNQNFNGGYGDWEAGVFAKCTSDDTKNCLFIGDIGHNCARLDQGKLRSTDQMPRLIEVEEPTAAEFADAKGTMIEKAGKEHPFKYPKDWQFDAEAMAVDNEGNILLITKGVSGGKIPYSWVFAFPKLTTKSEVVTLIHKAVLKVQYSEVTDATNTGGGLALRTYAGINWYKWDEMCSTKYHSSSEFQKLDGISKKGVQEALAYDLDSKTFYLLGEGQEKIDKLKCDPLSSTAHGTPAMSNDAACISKWNEADPNKQKRCSNTSGSQDGNGSHNNSGASSISKIAVFMTAALCALMA